MLLSHTHTHTHTHTPHTHTHTHTHTHPTHTHTHTPPTYTHTHTHSTSARLEVFSLDLASPGHMMPLAGAIEVPQRFHKLVWSGHGGGGGGEDPAGIIIGGSDNGTINMWSADRIIQ